MAQISEPGDFVNSRGFGNAVALDAVALDAVALDAVALDAVALDAVALDAVALDAVTFEKRRLWDRMPLLSITITIQRAAIDKKERERPVQAPPLFF